MSPRDVSVQGHVSPGFEAVRHAFAENFTERQELGAACCAYVRGQKVVDLWGGLRNQATEAPWEQNTMVIVHSATKGPAAMTLAVAHSRGWLDYERPVADYWPEFAQHGKGEITVQQLLAHQAGLFALDEPVTAGLVASPDRLAAVLARQKPAWKPGTRHGYHAVTLGFYQSEILRRVDPDHRTLGRFFQDEIATPLGLDFYIRLPETIPNDRLATIVAPTLMQRLAGFPVRMAIESLNPHSNIMRALHGSELPLDDLNVYARNLEIPSGGGVGTARALAGAYSVFATGGRQLGLAPDTLARFAAPAVVPSHGAHDECMKGDSAFAYGFMKPCAGIPFGSPSAYGHPGAGGAMGFADPETGLAWAYVTNRMGTTFTGDPRDVALRDALHFCLTT